MAKKKDLSNLITKKPGSVKKSPTQISETDVSKIHDQKPKAKEPVQGSTIQFPKSLWLKLKTQALTDGLSFKALVLKYCEAGLENEE